MIFDYRVVIPGHWSGATIEELERASADPIDEAVDSWSWDDYAVVLTSGMTSHCPLLLMAILDQASPIIAVGALLYELSPDGILVHRLLTRPDFRRRGVATRLVERMRERHPVATREGYQTMFVDERQLSLQLFLRSAGFRVLDLDENARTYPMIAGA